MDRAPSLLAPRHSASPLGSDGQTHVLSQPGRSLDSSTTTERREITMSLFKRGSKWSTRVWIDGVPHQKSTGTSNRRQAKAIDRQFHDELNEARHRLPQLKPEMTFGELTTQFIANAMAKTYSLGRLTQLLPFFKEMPLFQIN